MKKRYISSAYYEAGREKEKERKKQIEQVSSFIDENIPWNASHDFDEELLMYRIADLLREEKEKQKRSNVWLSVRAELSERAVSEYFNLGTSVKDMGKMLRICKALGLNPCLVMLEAMLS